MFLTPRIFEKKSNKSICFDKNTEIVSEYDNKFIISALEDFISSCRGEEVCSKITITLKIPDDIKKKTEELGEKYAENDEAYAITIDSEIRIYAESTKGVHYAVATLMQMRDKGELCRAFIYDYPLVPMRGLKVYTPGDGQEEIWKKTIDLLAYYKHNFIILEIGGGMEFKRHPEINEEWVKYLELLKKNHPDTWRYDQARFNYPVDPVQHDNAGGRYVSQEKMRELVAYCRERNIDVVPEAGSYSHCEYLVRPHPELREVSRATKHPDSYCPSNPDTYKLYFDVLDEIIDVIEPKYVHIGHDELIVSSECERCRDREPSDILAEDINKINDYLKTKNVKTMMWCDSLMDIATGYGYGKEGDWDYVPQRYLARDKVSKDVLLVNWYWRFGVQYDIPLLERDFNLIYGNLYGAQIPSSYDSLKKRIHQNGVLGGVVSSWTNNDLESLRCYNVFSGLVCLSHLFWDKNTQSGRNVEVFYKSAEEMYFYHNKYICPSAEKRLELIHAIVPEEDNLTFSGMNQHIGDYIVMFSDGETAKLPVIYGKNIYMGKMYFSGFAASSSAVEVRDGDRIFYKCEYENPYPEKDIIGINFLKQSSGGFHISVKSIRRVD